jgi:hypothetical protein
VSYRLWWRWNDGVSGHVWLSEGDVERLTREMERHGSGELAARIAAVETEGTITPQEVTRALERLPPVPIELEDSALWGEWLAFLAGAEQKGGLLVRR